MHFWWKISEFYDKKAKMTLKFMVIDLHFHYQPGVSQDAGFCKNLVILAQICDELWCGQAEFPRILSQNSQNDLKLHGQ